VPATSCITKTAVKNPLYDTLMAGLFRACFQLDWHLAVNQAAVAEKGVSLPHSASNRADQHAVVD
jgi:hypothetical protein